MANLDLDYELSADEVAEAYHMSATEAFRLMARAQFREFNKGDFYAYAGVETRNPMIADLDGYVLVLDGDVLNVIHELDSFGGQLFRLRDFG